MHLEHDLQLYIELQLNVLYPQAYRSPALDSVAGHFL